jgi:hypothetical protein
VLAPNTSGFPSNSHPTSCCVFINHHIITAAWLHDLDILGTQSLTGSSSHVNPGTVWSQVANRLRFELSSVGCKATSWDSSRGEVVKKDNTSWPKVYLYNQGHKVTSDISLSHSQTEHHGAVANIPASYSQNSGSSRSFRSRWQRRSMASLRCLFRTSQKTLHFQHCSKH